MSDNNFNIDKVLVETTQKYIDDFKQFGPDFSRIEANVAEQARTKHKKRRTKLGLRIAAALIAVFIVMNGLIFFLEAEPVKAYRTEMRKLVFGIFNDKTQMQTEAEIIKSSTQIEKIEERVPFSLPTPSWLPEGLIFNNATFSEDNDVITVMVSYQSGSGDLMMNITNDSSISHTIPSLGEGKYEEIMVNGFPVYISQIDKDGVHRTKCNYFDKQGLYIYISTSLDKQSLLTFIESLKYK